MQNWYCLVNFPDGTQSVHLVPGPAPIPGAAVTGHPIVKLIGKADSWEVLDVTVRVERPDDIAAEIWVRPATGTASES